LCRIAPAAEHEKRGVMRVVARYVKNYAKCRNLWQREIICWRAPAVSFQPARASIKYDKGAAVPARRMRND
jgi:hypothetical protein